MTDIMELIKDYGLNFKDRNYTTNSKIEKQLESRISAMQEVCDKASIVAKEQKPEELNCYDEKCNVCALIQAVAKLEALK